MAAEDLQQVVISKREFDQLLALRDERNTMLKGLLHIPSSVMCEAIIGARKAPCGASAEARIALTGLENIHAAIKRFEVGVNSYRITAEKYIPPIKEEHANPELEKMVQELEGAAAELKRVNEWLARNANRIAESIMRATLPTIQNVGLGSLAVTGDLAFLEYLNELKIKK